MIRAAETIFSNCGPLLANGKLADVLTLITIAAKCPHVGARSGTDGSVASGHGGNAQTESSAGRGGRAVRGASGRAMTSASSLRHGLLDFAVAVNEACPVHDMHATLFALDRLRARDPDSDDVLAIGNKVCRGNMLKCASQCRRVG